MKNIIKLSPQLIAQIAAGEVIERPFYAVKELIDNAIDANATEINITLEDGGLKKIIISDNGNGMGKEDLLESYKIHTTSKVKNEDSLSAITSMGFRGEALASIAAVAKLEIKSRTDKDIAGYKIEVSSGKLISEGPVGMPKGTIIEISNIFSKIPARKKFLKSSATELRNIVEIFISFSLMFPEIKFTLTHNKKKLFDLQQTTDSLKRISAVLNESTINNLIPVTKSENSYIKVSGFIAKPQYTTQSVNKQFIFVNNRRIQDKTISQAVKDSYSSLIPDRQLPVFLLFINIPFELVDVNVHPRKEQLAFHSPQTIYEAVFNTIKETLNNFDLTFNKNTYSPITKSTTGDLLKENSNPWQVKKEQLQINFSTLQQVHKLYLTVETKYGLLIVDQHAAHERILFEQYKKEFINQKSKKNTLVKPLSINLTIQEKLLVQEYVQELNRIGIEFNNSLTAITCLPKIFSDREIKQTLKELLEMLEQKNYIKEIDSVSLKVIQFLSCKNAVKAGDKLEKNEGIKLIKKLEQTDNNYTCPHGRPTKYIFALKELNKLFKRF